MRTTTSRWARDGALVTLGAALMLVVLLVLQSLVGSGLLSAKTLTSTITMTATPSSSSGEAFVIFHQQESGCGFIHFPWGVTIENKTSNETLVQPPSGLSELKSLLPGEGAGTRYSDNASTIAVLLSNGEYNYTLLPSGLGGKNHTSGGFSVDGAAIAIQFPNDFCAP